MKIKMKSIGLDPKTVCVSHSDCVVRVREGCRRGWHRGWYDAVPSACSVGKGGSEGWVFVGAKSRDVRVPDRVSVCLVQGYLQTVSDGSEGAAEIAFWTRISDRLVLRST